MMERLKAAWAAFRGAPVLIGTGVVAVSRMPNGDFGALRWVGMTGADAAKILYQGADAVTNALFEAQECSRTVH